MPVVLLTGFEPFGGQTVNPSWQAVQRLAAAWDGPAELVALELPVDFRTAGPALAEAVERSRPDLVVAVGQAGGRPDVTVERVAINVDDARIPDNGGFSPVDEPVVPGGPAAYFATLPVKACVAAMTAAGVPASVSQTAGTFVCNHVFYQVMHELAGRSAGGPVARGGFVHVPFTPEQAAGTRHPSMTLDVITAGLDTIVRTSLSTGADLRVTGGTTH